MTTRTLPFQHLSIRVPWHDTGWKGSICASPLDNASCLRLGRIASERRDEVEVAIAGSSWADLGGSELPPCAAERAGFMAETTRTVTKRHPYAAWNEVYRRFQPTSFDLPPFSADCVPFRWMLRESAVELADGLQLGYQAELEEAVDIEAELGHTTWVQHAENQQLLLDTFFSAIREEASLAFIYAKETPLTDDPRRVLIGVGRVRRVHKVIPYLQHGDGFGSVLWERVVEHSIRPTMEDGFLLPYHELLDLADVGVDPSDHVVLVPDEFLTEFSYASEHVSHDAAVALLVQLDRAVEGFASLVDGNWTAVRSWISDRLAEVWVARGPSPGLGAALTAFGVGTGVLLAHEAQNASAENEDPWPLIDAWLRGAAPMPAHLPPIGDVVRKTWVNLPEERRALLKLLARFDLTIDQAIRTYVTTERTKAGIRATDADLLKNPYRLFEDDRMSREAISVETVDRGVFPADIVRSAHPLPSPSAVQDAMDERRVRALAIDVLERAASDGDTLLSRDAVIQAIREAPLDPSCPVTGDTLATCEPMFSPLISAATMGDGSAAFQLDRLAATKAAIRKQVTRRLGAKPLEVSADWRALIDQVIDGEAPGAPIDEEEEAARVEKAAALQVLATSRFSVLIGAAGTGKTTLLRALSAIPAVESGGLVLLAPTGKARVRMQESIGKQAMTLAQLLVRSGRYDPETGRYQRSDADRSSLGRTVIVDECSMLTEEALDALLDGIDGFDRLILVGDHRQLPPIGAGRPFVDIIRYLREQAGPMGTPRVGPGYAELRVPRRQVATGSVEGRADVQLASLFAGEDPDPGADEVWDRLRAGEDLPTVAVRTWNSPQELHGLMQEELARSLPSMSGADDAPGFETSYGGKLVGEYVYFDREGAEHAESWQVLSPLHGRASGVVELNRLLKHTYRAGAMKLARNEDGKRRRIPKPFGPQGVVYGDKVINVRNVRRKYWFPNRDDALGLVANGEIGVVTGPFQGKGKKVPTDRLNVTFTTQPAISYTYWPNELGSDDGASLLELAWAITIHKSQGSEFATTFVVVPANCQLLSRELLYTALTRQRERVVILCEGELGALREYSGASFSETAGRLTNLFDAPRPIAVGGRFLEEGLVHKTRAGIAVRSKSEVIIADLLFSKEIPFAYERTFVGADGSTRAPDFTIEDDMTGTTFIWEHLGMLDRPSYRRSWAAKEQWYRTNGVLPVEEGGGPNGTLIVTKDEQGSISSAAIEALVDDLLG